MKNLFMIIVFLFSSIIIMGQSIEELSISPTNFDTINVNVITINGDVFGYLAHDYSIVNDTIFLNVCYLVLSLPTVTIDSSTFPIELDENPNLYILDLAIFSTFSSDCDYNASTDSAIMAFSTPVIDSLFLSVPTIENSLNNLVKIYPNPVHNIMHIQSDRLKIRSLALYTPSGIKVKSQNKNNQELYLSDLSKGVYILKIDTDKGMISKKIFKE